MMRKLLFGLLFLVIILIAALAIVPMLVPSSVYKDTIQTQLTRELQRDVQIEGDVKLSVLPVITANTGRVVIANPDGFEGDVFASIDELDTRIRLLPLFSRRVEISKFSLKNPTINLIKRADGRGNWEIGETPSKPQNDQGPFKRDGRYANIDPAIGRFSLENGTITYRDAAGGQSLDLENANLNFSLPSLSTLVSIKGDVVANGEPIDMSISLNSPRKFLDGESANINFSITTNFADVSGKGQFLPGEEITATLDLNGEMNDFAAAQTYLPDNFPADELLKQLTFAGIYTYQDNILRIEDGDISAIGDMLDIAFKGNATLAETPVIDGNINANVTNVRRVSNILREAEILTQDIQGLNLLTSARVSADFEAEDLGFSARNIDASIIGDGLETEFKGTATYGDTVTASGTFDALIASVPTLLQRLDQDIPQAKALGSISSTGDLNYSEEQIQIDFTQAETQGEFINGSYVGALNLVGDIVNLDGRFDGTVRSITQLAAVTELDIPYTGAVGRISAQGAIRGTPDALDLTELNLRVLDGPLSATYTGAASVKGEVIALEGNFDANVPSLPALKNAAALELPAAADAIGGIEAAGTISGPITSLNLNALNATLKDGQINGTFTGSALLAEDFRLDGTLDANIPSVRSLAQTTGTTLPPNTPQGNIFEAFNIKGAVKGRPEALNFDQASISLDKFIGTGQVKVDMTGAKPKLTGSINMNEMDLRPYMASYATQAPPNGQIQPWSDAPINVEGLRALDADFRFSTPKIITSRLTLGETIVSAKLRDGLLTTDIPNVALYGGLGRIEASLDARNSIPAISLVAKLDDYNTNTLYSALAGFTNLSGEGNTILDIKGSGRTQAEIMKSLRGSGNFTLLDGAISGVELSTLLTGLEQAVTNFTFPANTGIGPNFTTQFQDIKGAFSVENGVARINQFNLEGFGVAALGEGSIDLGSQKISFSLQPRLTGAGASELAKFGIPLKLEGAFGQIKPTIDTQKIQQIVAARAQARVREELQGRLNETVGGTAGDLIQGVLGGEGRTDTQGSNTPSSGQNNTGGTQTPTVRPEDAVRNVLGGILGGQRPGTQPSTPSSQTPPQDETTETNNTETADEEKTSSEDALEDAILGIFGGRKKSD